MSRKYDLLGKRFGKLSVTGREMDKKGTPWKCVCECGNKKLATSHNLTSSAVRSCGCLRSESRIIDLSGQRYGRLIAQERAYKKKNNSQIWVCKCDCGNTCEVSAGNLRSGATGSCGCILNESRIKAMKTAKEKRSDTYIEGTDIYQLCQKPRRNNTSGTVGVQYDKSVKTWKAYIHFKRKRYYLGSSANINIAIALRREAEQRLHSEFLDWYQRHVNHTQHEQHTQSYQPKRQNRGITKSVSV